MSLAPLQPDELYCVYCHRPAAGRCARCHALICADCADLESGLSRPVAVCHRCLGARPPWGLSLLKWLWLPALLLAAAVAGLLFLLR